MSFTTVNARFMRVLLPLVITCFVLIASVTYYMASEMLMEDAVMVSRCIGNEAALRMQLSVANIHLPLKVACSNHALLEADEEEVLAFLGEIRQSSPLIAQTFFIQPDGQTLRADGVHLDRSSREYFQQVVRTKQPYISKPFLGETTKKMQTMVLQPILEDGQLRAILMASIHLTPLTKQALEGEIFSDGSVYITGENGLVAGASDNPAAIGASAEKIGDPRLAAALREAIESQRQTFTNYRPEGEDLEWCATVTPFELSGNRWTIISSYPQAKVTAPARRLLRITSVVFCAILLLGVLIIRYFARSISAPLENLAHEFRALHDGAEGETDASTSQDEIETLAEGVARMRVIHDQRQHFEKKASSDELTGLLNRYGFRRRVAEAVTEHAGHSAILAFADLDHLKHINDQIGHAAGDDAIATAARLLRQGFGEKAVIGRVGGDEFVIFSCREDNDPNAVEQTLALTARYNEENQLPYYVELSIGVTEFVCAPDMDMYPLMKAADIQLYEAKKHRRDTSIHPPDTPPQ
ncbi:MAG: GGDEF domain-containing protein [Schwartzia sp.]|nr:GGDEF domain-containing protein [Schwartzia sp. (in: firmicutes)]